MHTHTHMCVLVGCYCLKIRSFLGFCADSFLSCLGVLVFVITSLVLCFPTRKNGNVLDWICVAGSTSVDDPRCAE